MVAYTMARKKKEVPAPRIPRKKGQRANSKKHSDLYTGENPKGTIKGLGFAKVKDARASVAKIKASGRSHAHKTQAGNSYGANAHVKWAKYLLLEFTEDLSMLEKNNGKEEKKNSRS